jgi:hypothetical protein
MAEPTHSITIDGNFSDWAAVPSHFDPAGGPGVLHSGIPDTHDTDHDHEEQEPITQHTNNDASPSFAHYRLLPLRN